MPFSPGARHGSYEIQSTLGAGGMGEVYRARDMRLKREVALKILSESFAADSDRVARFQREAEVLASLNHPNIAAIYGIEESNGTRALVMELVEGETLAERIARGPIPVDEAMFIAKQVAEALEAAHEHAIIHRDLKPANIKVRPDGTAKVLDFGLAKAFEPSSAAIGTSQSPTLISPAMMTGVGVLLGTAAYMSPEQARGKAVDKRSDIWAFGCVLYEMVTGRPAFEGESIIEVIASVVAKEPDWESVPASVPPPVERLLRRCLARDQNQRLRDIGDAILELDDARRPQTSEMPTPPDRRRVAWAVSAIVVTAAALAVGLALWRPSSDADPSEAVRFTFLPPNGWEVPRSAPRVGRTNASDSALAVSPDGRQLAFIGSKGGQSVLFVQALDSLSGRAIAGTEGASSPFWSPDGRSISFFAADKLRRIDPAGGMPLTLCDAPNPRGGSWSGDVILFGMQGQPPSRVGPRWYSGPGHHTPNGRDRT
jgi:eukaryotic-like serine/threonine-protein kinase